MQDKPETRGVSMPQVQALPLAAMPMPKGIAIAIIEAIRKVQAADATGEGKEGARAFTYASINDVLRAAHDALNEVGLSAIPLEVSYSHELVTAPTGGQTVWANYGFQFRLIHESGESWIDERDIRHITIQMPSDGKGAGKAQSLATRDYLKGLLRIRTVEPDDEPAQNVSRETIEKRGSILFVFDTEGPQFMLPDEVEKLFNEKVKPLRFAMRKQWESANVVGLKELNEQARPLWLRIRAALDAPDPKDQKRS